METYYLQRRNIETNKNISKFFDECPYFRDFEITISLRNDRLCQDAFNIWKESLNRLWKPMIYFSLNSEINVYFTLTNAKYIIL